MHLGDRYQSYAKLEIIFREYCEVTRTRYYKRDCRTIQYNTEGNTSALFRNPKLIYSKIKYVCIHSSDGKIVKPKRHIRKRENLKKQECPAYFFFRVTSCGKFMELVAMNTRHNHEKTYMSKKMRERLYDTSLNTIPIINIKNEEVEEIEAEDIDIDYLEAEEDMELEGNSEIEYIRVTYDQDDIGVNANSAEKDNLDCSSKYSDEMTAVTDYDVRTEIQSLKAPFNYSGMIAPVFTPFKNDRKCSLNMEMVPKYLKYLSDKGIRGILVNGTSGEGTAMSVHERKIVAEKWITCARDYQMHVMIQVGGAPLPDVLELTSHAEKFGADSLLCLPELYMKPTTNFQLLNYLKLVSEAAPNTPLLYYHIPMFSNVTLHMGKFLNEIKNEVPTFCGIKFTSNALDEGVDALKANDGCFEIFLGSDKLMLGAYSLGLRSSIATTFNIFPELGIKILDNFKQNNFTYAKETQDDLSAIVDIISKYGDWVSTMKQAMNMLTPINCGPVRQPLPGLSEKQVKEMNSQLEKYKNLL